MHTYLVSPNNLITNLFSKQMELNETNLRAAGLAGLAWFREELGVRGGYRGVLAVRFLSCFFL